MDSQENTMLQEISLRSSNYDDLDNWIIDQSCNNTFGQTKYQCTHFVAEAHPTKYGSIRQSLLEVQARNHCENKLQLSLRRTELQIEKLTKAQQEEPDPIEKEIIQCDIDEAYIDKGVWIRKLLQSHMEKKYFLDYIKEEANEEEIRQALDGDPEEEDKYWIARMAKQSAVDMLSGGSINMGNMESILQMKPEHQTKTLNAALRYGGAVNTGIDKLKEAAEADIKYLDKDDDVTHLLTDGE